jgi:hypothetical protein
MSYRTSLYDVFPQNVPKRVWTPLTYITLRGLPGRTVKSAGLVLGWRTVAKNRYGWCTMGMNGARGAGVAV